MELHPNILEDKSVEKIFTAYEFLRPDDPLESDTLPKQNNPFMFNFSRGMINISSFKVNCFPEFKAADFQYKLYSILHSTKKSDADVVRKA